MKTIIVLFFLLTTRSLLGQVDTMNTVHDHTTLEIDCKGKRCKYWVDDKPVSKSIYEKHLNEPDAANCKPCYLRQADAKGNVLYEGDFYTDCCIGTFITRYASGKIKIKGQYKTPPTKIPDYNKGDCRPDGEWKYFKENGDIEKVETYKDGKLVK